MRSVWKCVSGVAGKRTLHAQSKIAAISPDTGKRMVQVRWEDGAVGSFPFVWLRDSAPFASQLTNASPLSDRSPTRTLTLNELNVQVKPERLALDPQGERIVIQWPPYHEVSYRSDWLRQHLSTLSADSGSFSIERRPASTWGRSELEKRLPAVIGSHLRQEQVLRVKLAEFVKYGLLVVKEAGDGAEVLRLLGYHPENMPPNKFRCYSHHVQGMHTGGTYKPVIPSLCALFVRQEPEESTLQLVDGFRVAELLCEAHPALFSFLCNTSIEYNVIGKNGHRKSNSWPVFTLSANGSVQQVVFDNALRSSKINVASEVLEDYYKALKTFNSYCYQSRNMMNLHLQRGDLVLIANRRILHGNTAFSENVDNWVDEIFLSDEPLVQTLSRANAKA